MSLTDDALEQVGRLFKENAELRERVEQVATQRDEWHRQNGLLRGERDAATARAEKAEARAQRLDEEALRLQRTIDEARKQRDDWHDEATRRRTRAEQAEAALAELREAIATDLDRQAHLAAISHVDGETCLEAVTFARAAQLARSAGATPRTVPERAADEQGEREGGGA